MNNLQTKNNNYEAIAWGALLIWWGITEMVHFLPEGAGALGVGLILICVNLARRMNGKSPNAFSTTVGLLALIWGGLELAGAALQLPFELPIFAILLIALGLIVLGRSFSSAQE